MRERKRKKILKNVKGVFNLIKKKRIKIRKTINKNLFDLINVIKKSIICLANN